MKFGIIDVHPPALICIQCVSMYKRECSDFLLLLYRTNYHGPTAVRDTDKILSI